jgi:hypothetical protein
MGFSLQRVWNSKSIFPFLFEKGIASFASCKFRREGNGTYIRLNVHWLTTVLCSKWYTSVSPAAGVERSDTSTGTPTTTAKTSTAGVLGTISPCLRADLSIRKVWAQSFCLNHKLTYCRLLWI